MDQAHNTLLLSLKEGIHSSTYHCMDEPGAQHILRTEPVPREHLFQHSFLMRLLEAIADEKWAIGLRGLRQRVCGQWNHAVVWEDGEFWQQMLGFPSQHGERGLYCGAVCLGVENMGNLTLYVFTTCRCPVVLLTSSIPPTREKP